MASCWWKVEKVYLSLEESYRTFLFFRFFLDLSFGMASCHFGSIWPTHNMFVQEFEEDPKVISQKPPFIMLASYNQHMEIVSAGVLEIPISELKNLN